MSDFSRELVIKITRDDSEALAKAKAYWAAEMEGQRKAAAAAKSKGDVDKAAEKAKADAAKEADQLIKQLDKAAVDRQKAEAKARVARARETNAAIRQADKAMGEVLKANLKELQAADAAAAKAKKESAAEVAKVVRQVEAQVRADARQWDKRELTDEEVQQRTITALIRKSNRDRVQEMVQAHGKEKGLLDDLKVAWGGPLGAIAKAGGAVAGVTVGMGALKDVAVAALTAMDEKTRQFADSTRDATRALIEQHRKQLEISGFMGAPGETGPELAKSAKLAAASGLSIGEASDVRMAAEANAFSLVDKEAVPARNGMPAVEAQKGVVSREVYDKGIQMAAKLAAVSGGDPADYGKGVGTLINLEGKRIDDPSVIANRLLQNERLANIGKFATTSGLFDQVDRNLPLVKSGVIPGPQLAGLTALYAESNQAEAATFTKQAVNAVSAGLLQARGMKIDDAFAADAQTTSKYFQGLGITQQDDVLGRLFKVGEDIRSQQAKAQASGGVFNANEYLMQQGFGNEHSRTALMAFAGKMDLFRDDILPTLDKKFAPGTIDATHANFQTTFLGKANAVRTGGEIAQAAVGEKFGDLNLAMEAEYNRQLASGKEMAPLSEYMAPPARNALTGTFGPQEIWRAFKGTTQQELLGPIGLQLDKELDRLGIRMPASVSDGSFMNRTFNSPGSMLSSGEAGWQDVARVFNEAVGKIQAAGGDATVGQGRIMEEMVSELKGLRADLQQANRNNRPIVPPAPRAAPAPAGGRAF